MKPVGPKKLSANADIYEPKKQEKPKTVKTHEFDSFTNNADVKAHVDMVAELTSKCVQLTTRRNQMQKRIAGLYQQLDRIQLQLEKLHTEIKSAEAENDQLNQSIEIVDDQLLRHGRQASQLIVSTADSSKEQNL